MDYLYKSLDGRTVTISNYMIRATGTSFTKVIDLLTPEVGVTISLETIADEVPAVEALPELAPIVAEVPVV
jgi:hypothetical protein